MPGHRRASGQDADEVVPQPDPEECCGSSLGDVEHGHGDAELEPERPPHVRRAGVPAPERADVHAREDPRQPVPERQAAEHVAQRDEEEFAQV